MKEVHFDKKLGHLVDEEGIRYEGRRVDTLLIDTWTGSDYHPSPIDWAEYELTQKLNQKKDDFDSHEIIFRKDYDLGRRRSIVAILYKDQ